MNQTKSKVRILIADNHEIVRKVLITLIEKEDDMKVIAQASNGEEAVRLARNFLPDIILMDVNMPVLDGIEATRELSGDSAKTKACIIGLSIHNDEQISLEMKRAGAAAYLTKTEASETLCTTIRNEMAKMNH